MGNNTTNHYVPAISERKPSFLRRFLPLTLILGSIFILIVLTNLREPPPAEEKPPVSQLVDTVTVSQQNITYKVISQGTVEPTTETTIVPEVAGKIVNLSPDFVAGGYFKAGQVLMEIDPSDYKATLTGAEANLSNALSLLAEEEARSTQALKDWEKLNGTSRQANTLVLREPQLAQAKSNVKAMEATLQMARRDMERTKISLPYDGIVKDRQIDLGQYVSTGTVLGTAFAIKTAEVRLPLTENDINYLLLPDPLNRDNDSQHLPVKLYTNSPHGNHTWDAKLIRTEGVVDSTTRVTYAVAMIEDPYGISGKNRNNPLRMGVFVNAEIEGISAYNVVSLPRASLRADGSILIADENNKLDVREVTIDRTTPTEVYISSGIEPGERVITTAIAAALPGSLLRVVGEENNNFANQDNQNLDNLTTDDTDIDSNDTYSAASSNSEESQSNNEPNDTSLSDLVEHSDDSTETVLDNEANDGSQEIATTHQ